MHDNPPSPDEIEAIRQEAFRAGFEAGQRHERRRALAAYAELEQVPSWRRVRTYEEVVRQRKLSFGPIPPRPVQTDDWPAIRMPGGAA